MAIREINNVHVSSIVRSGSVAIPRIRKVASVNQIAEESVDKGLLINSSDFLLVNDSGDVLLIGG